MPFLIDPETEQYDFLTCSMSERQMRTIMRGLTLIRERNFKEPKLIRKAAEDMLGLMSVYLDAKERVMKVNDKGFLEW